MLEELKTIEHQVDGKQSEIFFHIGRVLTSSLNPKEVFERVMKIIGEYFSPRNWSLFLMEEKTGRLKFEIVMGADSTKLKNTYIEKGEGIVSWVCEHGEPLIVKDVKSDPRFSPRIDKELNFTTKSIICVPILNANNRVVGAIELINKIVPPSVKSSLGKSAKELIPSEKTFTETDMKLLSSIGVFTGIATENAFLHQKVKDLAMIDPLTGINNRHFFNEMFHREIERVKRYNHNICMLMIDVDKFKKINDTFGHLTGDKVLKIIADILSSSVRESDILARFGGDEFVIIMPLTGEKEGHELEDRIRRLIYEWNDKKSIPAVSIDVSIGVYAAGPDNVDDVLLNADIELYRNKKRDRKIPELSTNDQLRRFLQKSMRSKKQ